jgi:hypothetical protein
MFLIFCFSVYCQDDWDETDETTSEKEFILNDMLLNDNYGEDSIFIINSFNYNVIGRTLPFVLNNKTELKKGEEITGKTNLLKFIKDKGQILTNERVLKDNVRIEYTIGEATEDGKYPVDMEIYVEDTWNIIALPYPKFDSNYGLNITIKARDYNFFGTMQPLRVDLGYKYKYNEDKNTYQSYFSLMVDSGLPFQVFGLNFLFDFDNFFDYRPDMDLPYYFKNITGISLDIPIKRTTLTLLFAESFILNEENSDSDKPIYGEFQEGLYLSSKPSISWKIPTGLEIGEYGELTYTPNVYAVFNHKLQWELDKNRIGPILYFNHTLSFGRINWIDNFREGINFQVNNLYNYNFYYQKDPIIDKEPLSYDYSIETKAFFIFIKDIFGLSTRLSFRHWINSYYEYAGDALRGVRDVLRDVNDNVVNVEFILSLNLDIHIRALKINAYDWFPNNKFLRSLGFDLHINPVIDGAFYKQPSKDVLFDPENFLLGAGFETIIYPHQFRSLFFRISLCWNFSNISKGTPWELFLGMEHHY